MCFRRLQQAGSCARRREVTHTSHTHTDITHTYVHHTHTHRLRTHVHTHTTCTQDTHTHRGREERWTKGPAYKTCRKKNENHRFRYVLLSEIKIVPHFSLNDARES